MKNGYDEEFFHKMREDKPTMYKSITKTGNREHLILGPLWSRSRETKQPDEMRSSHIIWMIYEQGYRSDTRNI